MGGTISCNRVKSAVIYPTSRVCRSSSASNDLSQKAAIEEDEYEMDENYVFSALFKLSFHFEIDESAPRKLTNLIVTSREGKHNYYTNHRDDRACVVRSWAKEYAKARLSFNEVHNLIKYVELYSPSQQQESEMPVSEVKDDDEYHDGDNDGQDYNHLVCPYRCEMAAWSAEINRQRLSRSVTLYSDTVPSKEYTWSNKSSPGKDSHQQPSDTSLQTHCFVAFDCGLLADEYP